MFLIRGRHWSNSWFKWAQKTKILQILEILTKKTQISANSSAVGNFCQILHYSPGSRMKTLDLIHSAHTVVAYCSEVLKLEIHQFGSKSFRLSTLFRQKYHEIISAVGIFSTTSELITQK